MTKIYLKNPKHKAIKCNVKGCKAEAVRWFATKELSGDFDMKHKDTFYLCDNHQSQLSPEDDTIQFLNPETGKIRYIELAVYSCDEDCKTCNQ